MSLNSWPTCISLPRRVTYPTILGFTTFYSGARAFRSHINVSYFSQSNKIPDKSNLRKEELLWSNNLWGEVGSGRNHRRGSLRQVITLQRQPGSRDLQLLALAQCSPPCQHSAHGMESCTFRAFPPQLVQSRNSLIHISKSLSPWWLAMFNW